MTLYITTFDTRVGDLTLHGAAAAWHHGYQSVADLQQYQRDRAKGLGLSVRLIKNGIELDSPREWTRLELR